MQEETLRNELNSYKSIVRGHCVKLYAIKFNKLDEMGTSLNMVTEADIRGNRNLEWSSIF
jgi:hypothetical protein